MAKTPSRKRTIRVPAPKPRLPLAPPTRKHEERKKDEPRKKWRDAPPVDPEDQE
jgi:hypothetical protein